MRVLSSTPTDGTTVGVLSASSSLAIMPPWPRMVATELVSFFYPALALVKGQIMTTIDPTNATLPETGFLRQSQVLVFIPISKSTLWRRVLAGTFPAPVKLSSRVTAWRAEDIRLWIGGQGERI